MSEFTKGVFTVQQSGRISADFIYDGGGYQSGELAIFSLEGMNAYQIGLTNLLRKQVVELYLIAMKVMY
jgi:hypothetical protein